MAYKSQVFVGWNFGPQLAVLRREHSFTLAHVAALPIASWRCGLYVGACMCARIRVLWELISGACDLHIASSVSAPMHARVQAVFTFHCSWPPQRLARIERERELVRKRRGEPANVGSSAIPTLEVLESINQVHSLPRLSVYHHFPLEYEDQHRSTPVAEVPVPTRNSPPCPPHR